MEKVRKMFPNLTGVDTELFLIWWSFGRDRAQGFMIESGSDLRRMKRTLILISL